MPKPYVRKVAKEKGISVGTAEKKWKRAKKAAEKSYGKPTKKNGAKFWGTVTKIFKNMTHVKEEFEGMTFDTYFNKDNK